MAAARSLELLSRARRVSQVFTRIAWWPATRIRCGRMSDFQINRRFFLGFVGAVTSAMTFSACGGMLDDAGLCASQLAGTHPYNPYNPYNPYGCYGYGGWGGYGGCSYGHYGRSRYWGRLGGRDAAPATRRSFLTLADFERLTNKA